MCVLFAWTAEAIMDNFSELDVDASGTLEEADLQYALARVVVIIFSPSFFAWNIGL